MKQQSDLFTGLTANTAMLGYYCNLPETSYIYFDYKGKIIDCCEKLCTRYQINLSDLLGQNLLELSDNKSLRILLQNQDSSHTILYEGTIALPGADRHIRVSACFFRIDKSDVHPKRIIGFIDEPSNHLESLQSFTAADHFRIIAENVVDAISLHDLKGDLIYMTPSVVKLHGYTDVELMQLGVYHAVYPDDVQIIHDVLDKIRNNQENVKAKYRLIHRNGHIVWVESISQSIKDNSGAPAGISVITRDITSGKLMEDSLRQNEEKYRTLVKNLPTGIMLLNTKGEILEVNQSLLDILGSPGEEPTRMINMFEFENLVNAGISADLIKCIGEKKVVNGQAEYVSKWGKHSYLLYSAVPIFDAEGEVIQVIGNVRDVTRIKKAEEKSQQQIDFLNIVINTMQEPFFVKDEHHRWIMLNDAAIEMMGHPREELIGKSDYELFPKDQADIFWQKDAIVLKNGSNVNEENITWSDGSERTIITNKKLYTESNTGKKYIVGTIHDITELKKTEIRLRESERKYHDLFDNANDFIFTTDINGVFTNANKALLNRLDIDIEELHKFTIFSFCKPETLDYAHEVTSVLLKTGNIDPFEIETPEFNGKSAILEIRARLIYNNTIPVGIQGIARDVSDKKLASQKLEQVNQELQEMNASKDKFYSIIAHDLKNPFNSLIGFSELLLDDFDDLSKDEMRDYVGIIRNTARNSLILLENLLAWSRLQTGRMIYNPVKLVLANEVDATTTVLYSLSYRKKIEVENCIDKNITVKADQNMLLSIMHNLVMNAIKFTPSSGKISIQCNCIYVGGKDRQEGFAEISVSDTGIGISAEDQAKLFSLTKPFTMPGTEKESGTGLGLLLTREMVEKHGGTIKIVSEPGKGSTFTFRVPLFVP
jgi:PAS domain S-box-containing protein